MDRQAAAKQRYEGLKKALTDDRKVRKKTRRTRVMGLAVLGVWVIVPALLFDVDLDSVAAPEFFRRPTPHEAHLLTLLGAGSAVGADETAVVRKWEAAAFRAIDFPISIGSAYQEVGVFPLEDPQAFGLRVHIPEGQRLRLRVDSEGGDPGGLFVDVFRAAPDSLRQPAREPSSGSAAALGSGSAAALGSGPAAALGSGPAVDLASSPAADLTPRPAFVLSGEMEDGRWHFDPPEAGDYVLRLQPELGMGGRYRAALQIGAPWIFPVAGAGESDIGGVFGDPRDGGGREHHGVDIFRPRGTPVLAASDGRVTSVDTTEIGGRVVWLREVEGGHSIYYAHLETPLVRDGQRLHAGDTVGLVGNTGNARTTPPHLHFGAYRRGPVDPWNLILPIPPGIPDVRVGLDALGREGQVAGDGALIRVAPNSRGTVLAELPRETSVRILAGAGDWYRVLLPGDGVGFIEGTHLALPTPNGTQPSNNQ